MSWVTVVWSMVASACLTLAAIYALVWSKNRTAWAHLLFAATAAATAVFTLYEFRLLRAGTPEELLTALKWGHLALLFWLVSIIWFVRLHLGAGRLWLAVSLCVLRTLYLVPTFLVGPSFLYREITSLRRIPLLGDEVTIFTVITSPWMLVGQVINFMIIFFVADASVTVWRRGERRKALIVGGSIEFFLILAMLESALIYWAQAPIPILLSPFYLGMVAVMGYEVSRDVLRASQLVHELQVSEAGLRESEARMSLAVETAGFGLWIRDLTRDDVWASERWRGLFGFAPTERLDFDRILQRVHSDDRARLEQAQSRALAGVDGGRYQMEFRLTLPDGVTRWISSQSRVEFDAAGQPVLMRGASRDITARKQGEDETLRLRQEIAHAGRVSMMGQLAASLAHEINQPLGAILRNAEAAELYLQQAPPDLDEIGAILADIRSDDERAGQVIDRMRGLLKRQSLDRRRLDLGEVVAEVAALVRVDAATRQVTVDLEVPGDLPPVQGDRVHLQQVLLNLILNGMDALNGAAVEDRRVSVAVRLDCEQTVEIAVSDAGPGIPAEALAQIFTPFFTTKPTGMGMGLAISRTIVEAHGGRIWAENRNGGGAAFRFTLPIAKEAVTQ